MKRKITYILFIISFVFSIIIYLLLLSTRSKVDEEIRPSYIYENILRDEGKIAILTYHRISPCNKFTMISSSLSKNNQLHEYNVRQDEFIEQINYLIKNNIKVYNMEDLKKYLMTSSKIPLKGVVITFDDIDIGLYKYAYPILKSHDIPFTQFINTGNVGSILDGARMESWDKINIMAENKSLVNIGLHTNNFHYQVNGQPILQTDISHEHIEEDFNISKECLYKNTGRQAYTFAYPYGAQNEFLSNYMLSKGIDLVFTLEPGLVNNDTNRTNIPRLIVTEKSWISVKKWLEEK